MQTLNKISNKNQLISTAQLFRVSIAFSGLSVKLLAVFNQYFAEFQFTNKVTNIIYCVKESYANFSKSLAKLAITQDYHQLVIQSMKMQKITQKLLSTFALINQYKIDQQLVNLIEQINILLKGLITKNALTVENSLCQIKLIDKNLFYCK